MEPIAPVLTPEGWELLNSLGPYREDEALHVSDSLRRAGHAPEVVAAVLTQSRLRERAAAKFGEFADRMIFTRDGLEQATRLQVAVHHAQRFASAGLRRIADLGCGVGADAMAMSAMDLSVLAVEQDETTAAAATVNLMPWPAATVVQADARDVDLSGVDGVWLDPARRTVTGSGTRRVFDPEVFSPPLSFVEELADGGLPVGVKLGPGLPHEAVPAGCEAQWVSVGGDVTEVALWFNALARPGIRRAALVLGPQGAAEMTSGQDFGHGDDDVPLGSARGFLYEPDGAVIRAGLVADLARHLGGHLLDRHIAYFCADSAHETPFARAYRVLEVRPYNVKDLRAWVRAEGITTLDIKKRGMAVTPEEVRRLLLGGRRSAARGRRATLVLTRVGADRLAVVVEPVVG